MTTQSALFLIATLLLLLTDAHSLIDPTAFLVTAHTPAPAPAPTPTTNTVPTRQDIEFIRTSCESTRYPKVCYNSLSHYASAVQRNPGLLARVAIAVSLSNVRQEAIYFSNVSKEADFGANHRVAAALHDCYSVFGDAVDQVRGSLNQMRNLVHGSGEIFRFQMSNVQTWMSAALTNEDTCTDGFDGVAEGPMKKDVCDRVQRVTAVTSNALALVNSYADQTGRGIIQLRERDPLPVRMLSGFNIIFHDKLSLSSAYFVISRINIHG